MADDENGPEKRTLWTLVIISMLGGTVGGAGLSTGLQISRPDLRADAFTAKDGVRLETKLDKHIEFDMETSREHERQLLVLKINQENLPPQPWRVRIERLEFCCALYHPDCLSGPTTKHREQGL